ncbi:hypothetical protein SNEBB_002856 [Seison nebaliae]|nr:hypothetical protein SNEBB_002856 [Seison nebaliae]
MNSFIFLSILLLFSSTFVECYWPAKFHFCPNSWHYHKVRPQYKLCFQKRGYLQDGCLKGGIRVDDRCICPYGFRDPVCGTSITYNFSSVPSYPKCGIGTKKVTNGKCECDFIHTGESCEEYKNWTVERTDGIPEMVDLPDFYNYYEFYEKIESATLCDPRNFPINSSGHCQWDKPFTLPDPCSPNPCMEGGKCYRVFEGNNVEGKCICPKGRTGDTCAENYEKMGSCGFKPYQFLDNGKCIPNGKQLDYRKFECDNDFTGDNCRERKFFCNMSEHDATGDFVQCSAKGTKKCIESITGPICLCNRLYSGDHCESKEDLCLNRDCKNGGTCVIVNGDYGEEARCYCPRIYKGSFCEFRIGSCSRNPCKYGQCVDEVKGFDYHCNCVDGWTGIHCEDVVNNCNPNPCHNNGICATTTGKFHCTCPDGYYGHRCENNYNDCSINPCGHGGKCIDDDNDVKCICTPGTSGHYCDIYYHICDSNPCRFGKCIATADGKDYRCSCFHGYAGPNCNHLANVCTYTEYDDETHICGLSDHCIPTMDGISCACDDKKGSTITTEFLSKLYDIPTQTLIKSSNICEVYLDKCKLKGVCGNGTCVVDKDNNLECICDKGFVGRRCEKYISNCADNKCENGAVCSPRADGYTCRCRDGFSGIYCHRKSTICDKKQLNLCSSHGECISYKIEGKSENFHCLCEEGYQGRYCEKSLKKCSCKNGGKCEKEIDGKEKCVCPQFFDGDLCENDLIKLSVEKEYEFNTRFSKRIWNGIENEKETKIIEERRLDYNNHVFSNCFHFFIKKYTLPKIIITLTVIINLTITIGFFLHCRMIRRDYKNYHQQVKLENKQLSQYEHEHVARKPVIVPTHSLLPSIYYISGSRGRTPEIRRELPRF